MLISRRRLVAVVLVPLTLGVPLAAQAQGVAVSTLSVGARVAPACSVSADSSSVDVDTSPSVRVVCGRTALRTLRASMDSASGDDVTPVISLAGRQWVSSSELIFAVPNLVSTQASRSSVLSLVRATGPTTVVVTLDF